MLQDFVYHLGTSEIASIQGNASVDNGVLTIKASTTSWPTIVRIKNKDLFFKETTIHEGCEKWWIFTALSGVTDEMEIESTSHGGIDPVYEFVRLKKNGQVMQEA